jgi:DNA-binding GntR family transcriptional regulator
MSGLSMDNGLKPQRRQRTETGGESGRRQQVYDTLKQGILTGVYQPNQRLTEMDLAQELGVSRLTVRLALVQLQQDGLVVVQANRGASVRSVSVPQALRVLKMRSALEGVAASLAAESVTDAEVGEMERILDDMNALGETETLKYAGLSNRLHALILRAAHDEMLEVMLATLNHALVRYQHRTILVPGRRAQSLSEHIPLVAALKRHDAAEAEQLMRTHVLQIRQTLLDNASLLA